MDEFILMSFKVPNTPLEPHALKSRTTILQNSYVAHAHLRAGEILFACAYLQWFLVNCRTASTCNMDSVRRERLDLHQFPSHLL